MILMGQIRTLDGIHVGQVRSRQPKWGVDACIYAHGTKLIVKPFNTVNEAVLFLKQMIWRTK